MIGNYSLADQLVGVGLTPLGEDVLNDPRAMQRMGNDLAGMSAYQPQGGVLLDAEPAGAVYGQEGSSFFSATPEDDTNVVLKAFQTIIGAPFNILRGAKEGLEEVIGHPYAAERDAQEQYIMAMSALRDPDKALIGMPVDRTGINDRQTNPSTVATGTAGGTSANMQPVRSWLPDLITGEKRKRRQREMARLQAELRAQGIKLNIEQAQADIYSKMGTGTSAFANARKTGVETDQLEEFGPQEWRGKIAKLGAETYQANAGGNANAALANQRNQMTPGMVAEQNAKALDAALGVNRNEEMFRSVTLPGGLEANDRNARQFWDITYPAGITANDQSKQAFSLVQGMREDERKQKATESDVRVKEGISKIEDRDLRTAAYMDLTDRQGNLYDAKTVTEGFQQEKLDAQTKTTVSLASAGIEKIVAQIAGMADTSRLLEARTRLEDIKGGVLLNRAEQDNAMNEVKRALLETRMELSQRAQSNNDLIAKFKIKAIDADIARIESIISLNGARENAVGVESSLGNEGGSSFGKALLGQAGKESQANLNALLGSAADDVGTVYDRANRLEMLGYAPGSDFGIIKGEKPSWRNLWSDETPDRIVFPKGSRLKGAAKGVQENAPAAKLTAPKEKTANPSPAFDDEKPAAVQSKVMQGQTSRAMTGRAADVLRKYPTPEAVVAAQKAGKITFEEGASALDALGVARRPRT